MHNCIFFLYILRAGFDLVLIWFYLLCIEVKFFHYDQKLDLSDADFGQELKKFGYIFKKIICRSKKMAKKADICIFAGFLPVLSGRTGVRVRSGSAKKCRIFAGPKLCFYPSARGVL